MQSDAESSKLPAEDYQAIEDAVMETARGRWFLAEYARRHRVAETEAIVSQLERMEKMIRRERQVPDIDRIRLDLADMAEAIHRTKAEIAQMQMETGVGGRFAEASSELDAIVTQTETATDTILLNAEKVQEMAWSLREAGVDDALCDQLDQNATEIYTACSFQDLTGQRTRKVVTVLRYLESRINSMIGIWGLESVEEATVVTPSAGSDDDIRPDAHLLNGPARLGEGIDQSAVDDLMDFSGTPEIDFVAFDAAVEFDPDVEFATADVVGAEPSPEADFPPPRPLSTADFEIRPRRAYDVIDDDVTIVVPDEVAFADPAEPAATEPSVATAAAADVFAPRDGVTEVPVLAESSKDGTAATAVDLDTAAADVFAPAERPSADALAGIEPEADVFAPAPEAAPSEAPQRARPRTRAAQPVVHGNTALAVVVAAEPEPEMAPAVAAAEPVLAVVPNADPIAALSPAEKLVVFG